MTSHGFDSSRVSLDERTGGAYSGQSRPIISLGNLGVDSCRQFCVSTLGCQSWNYTQNGICNVSRVNPGNFVKTPNTPGSTAGKVEDRPLVDAWWVAFWAMMAYLLLVFIVWGSFSMGGQTALASKVPYVDNGRIFSLEGLDD